MPGMLKDIIDSIFSPTTKPQAGVVKAMNYSFYALFATLLSLAYASSWNPHVFALTGVALALYFSISWFIVELGKIDDEQKKAGDANTLADNTTTEKHSVAQIPSAPGTESYAEVAAETPSQGTASSAIVNDRSGLTSRKGASQGSSTPSSAESYNANAQQDTYANVAAEEPDADSAVREDRQGKSISK